MSSGSYKTDLPPALVFDKSQRTNKWRIIAIVAIVIGVLLSAALITVTVLWTQQPKAPVWLEQRSVIRAVITETNTLTEAQRRSAADGIDSEDPNSGTTWNNTANDPFVPAKAEMTSMVLSVTEDKVQILVLPGYVQVDDIMSENSDSGTRSDAAADADDSDEVLPMILVTANPKTGDLSSVEASESAAKETQFLNTGMLVVQQLLADTTAIQIQSTDELNKKQDPFAHDEEDCSFVAFFGSSEYCKTARLIKDEVGDFVVYRKTFSKNANSRSKRDTDASGSGSVDDDSNVNVQVDSYVSEDTGLIEKGYVTASATLNVFTHGSEGKAIDLNHELHTDFDVDTNGISSKTLTSLSNYLLTLKLVKYDQLTSTPTPSQNASESTNSSSDFKQAKAILHPKFNLEIFRMFGQSVRVVADASITCCSAVGDFSLYVGPKQFRIAHKKVDCDHESYSATSTLAAYNDRFLLTVFPTPVGLIYVIVEMRYRAELYGSITKSNTSVSGTVQPQASAGLAVHGGWNFIAGEVGAGASVETGVKFPMRVTLNFEDCKVSSTATLVYNADGKVGLYYKYLTIMKKCWRIFRKKICVPWPSYSSPRDIISASVSASRSTAVWSH